QEVQDYADTDFKLAVIMTILLIAIIPYAITYYYYKEPFPPKTVTRTILVFIYWFLLVWLISAIIVYNPIYDWAKDLV
ncbi:MAG: hypothetical protein H8D46_01200, partial [FCB group bacterium]|nr:hypothetical protein [FCB group bacterium]